MTYIIQKHVTNTQYFTIKHTVTAQFINKVTDLKHVEKNCNIMKCSECSHILKFLKTFLKTFSNFNQFLTETNADLSLSYIG